jgi:hypothetical protein
VAGRLAVPLLAAGAALAFLALLAAIHPAVAVPVGAAAFGMVALLIVLTMTLAMLGMALMLAMALMLGVALVLGVVLVLAGRRGLRDGGGSDHKSDRAQEHFHLVSPWIR